MACQAVLLLNVSYISGVHHDGEKGRQHTLGREDIVVCTETEEEVKRNQPDTECEKGRNLHEAERHLSTGGRSSSFHTGCPGTFGPLITRSLAVGLFSNFREVVEPDKVVCKDEQAGQQEGWRCERDEREAGREVAQVDDMTGYAEEDQAQRKPVCEKKQGMQEANKGNEALANIFRKARMLFDHF